MILNNYIGDLQEYCQKAKLNLPEYNFSSENKFFRCEVKIYSNKVFHSSLHTTKKSAAQEAAQFALQYLRTNIKKESIIEKTIITNGNTLVLVDLENYPQMDTSGFVYPNSEFVGFVGKCSSFAQNLHGLKEKYEFMKIIVVDSVLNDAVDHFITMYIGMNISKYNNIIIVTRDKFAGCSVDAARQLSKNIKILHAASSVECQQHLQSLV